MDYSRFRFVFVVDWIELEVRLLKATQGQHLKNAGAGMFSHVHGINPQTGEKYPENRKGTTTTRFAVRIQAPERFTAITAALDTIRERLDPSCAITVCGIEVALDAYANDCSAPEELAEMASHLLKGINRVSSNHPRIYRERGETRAIGSHKELIRALQEGFQIGIGDGDGARFQHSYLKSTDDGQALPMDQHRARIEIRLQGDGCPVRTLEDLAGFDFAGLSNYFRFRQFSKPKTDLERLMADRQICLGNIIGDDGRLTSINRKGGGTRLNKNGTTASSLNEISRSRLRKLTERWQASSGRGKGHKAAAIACGNSACLESLGTVSSQPETAPPQKADTPRQCWGNSSLETTREHPSISTPENRSLITSYPPSADLAPNLAKPIKVICGITPYADLLPILHDLHQSPYPPLPNMAVDTADI